MKKLKWQNQNNKFKFLKKTNKLNLNYNKYINFFIFDPYFNYKNTMIKRKRWLNRIKAKNKKLKFIYFRKVRSFLKKQKKKKKFKKNYKDSLYYKHKKRKKKKKQSYISYIMSKKSKKKLKFKNYYQYKNIKISKINKKKRQWNKNWWRLIKFKLNKKKKIKLLLKIMKKFEKTKYYLNLKKKYNKYIKNDNYIKNC
jgi:hypothetical protein